MAETADDEKRRGDKCIGQGVSKAEIIPQDAIEPFFVAIVVEIGDENEESDEVKALSHHLTTEIRGAVNLGRSMDFLTFMNIIVRYYPAAAFPYQAASTSPDIKPSERQELRELGSIRDRLKKEIMYLSRETQILKLEKKLQTKHRKNLGETHHVGAENA